MTEIYEIVETSEGEFSLRRAETDETPLVTINFSSEAQKFLNDATGEIAKTMIEAGIHQVESIMEQGMEQGMEKEDSDAAQESKPLIH